VKINDIFTSIQGEGSHVGIPATFIRLQGCNVGCVWCDTKESWNNNDGYELSVSEISKQIQTHHVCITGGEPCLQNLYELTDKIRNRYVSLETSGTAELTGNFNWITLSPKLNFKLPIPSVISKANEIKFPVGSSDDLAKIKEFIDNNELKSSCLILLQPISLSSKATHLCVDECIKKGWRLSPQIHKFIGIK
jgi:7-carboxy-7-deazaguanine synthase